MSSSIETELNDLESKAQQAYARGQMDEALTLYRNRLEQAALHGLGEEEATSRKSIGLILHDMGEWEEGLGELEQALEIQTRLKEEKADNPDFQLSLANTHTNLAEVCRAMDDLQTALSHLQQAMNIQLKFAPESLLLAETYNSIGSIFGEVGNFKMALDFHTPACEIRMLKCPNTLTFSCSASNIGLILTKMGKFESAYYYLKMALDIEEQFIPGTLDMADSYSNIGEVLFKMDKNEEALPMFQKALDIKEKIGTSDALDVSKTHSDLGWVMHKMGMHEEAERHLEEAVDLEESNIPDSEALIQTYGMLIACRKQLGKGTAELEDKMHRILELQAEKQEILKD
jgi:tetratricopeptide (TPR) repeat protein